MTEVTTPTKKPSVAKSPSSKSKLFSFTSSGSKKALAEKNQAPEVDEVQERRKSVDLVTKAREAEQERLVDEAIIAQQSAKLEREESRRIVAAAADEERKRRLADAAAAEASEEQVRSANRKSVNEAMEAERERRMSEAPDSPSALKAVEMTRRDSKRAAVDAMEEERVRRLNLDVEIEQKSVLQRRKSQATVTAQMEEERERRMGPSKASKKGKTVGGGGIQSTLVFLLSTLAIGGLVVITLLGEDKSLAYLEDMRTAVGEYIPALAPPPPPPPPKSWWG